MEFKNEKGELVGIVKDGRIVEVEGREGELLNGFHNEIVSLQNQLYKVKREAEINGILFDRLREELKK